MDASKLFAKGRAGLILDHPFFGSLAMRLTVKEDPNCETAWVDGKTIAYNPNWLTKLSLDEIKGVICHEVMHCAARHMVRRGDRQPKRWNVAGDYAINQILVDAHLTLPAGALVNSQYRGMSAEDIYNSLPDDPGNGGSGQGKGDPGKCGEVRDAPGKDGGTPSESDKAQADQEWRVAVTQAATQAKAMGTLPAGLDRMIGEIIDPLVDWREALKRFVDTAAKNDYRWTPPSRRHIGRGVILPSLRSEELGQVAVALDTSGSISEKQLNQFGSELTAILEAYRANATVIYCDSEIPADGIEEYTADDLPLTLKVKGGGGTSFIPPFEHLNAGNPPACMVYFTDGECTRFPPPPEYPVLWVVDGRPFNPPFGEVTYLVRKG